MYRSACTERPTPSQGREREGARPRSARAKSLPETTQVWNLIYDVRNRRPETVRNSEKLMGAAHTPFAKIRPGSSPYSSSTAVADSAGRQQPDLAQASDAGSS